MDKIISALQLIPEYKRLLDALRQGQSAAVTGCGQINRSHMIAGIRQAVNVPVVVICQDDMAAKRMQS